ncbi:hypothetical protein F4804DRAFT_324262 [Jackrogersella minutella]|nr:hypothetical protein F4804DRAFT_324262 [Jackrogersella minutella]
MGVLVKTYFSFTPAYATNIAVSSRSDRSGLLSLPDHYRRLTCVTLWYVTPVPFTRTMFISPAIYIKYFLREAFSCMLTKRSNKAPSLQRLVLSITANLVVDIYSILFNLNMLYSTVIVHAGCFQVTSLYRK